MPSKRGRPPKAVQSDASGVILPEALYTLERLKLELRLGEWSLRQARRHGLRVLRYGGRAFVLGSDVIDFLSNQENQNHQ